MLLLWNLHQRSRGTPRIANKLFRRVRDFALVEGKSNIDLEVTKKALDRLKIDKIGLDETDRELLLRITEKFNARTSRNRIISNWLSEKKLQQSKNMYEPFLIQKGMIKRTFKRKNCNSKSL